MGKRDKNNSNRDCIRASVDSFVLNANNGSVNPVTLEWKNESGAIHQFQSLKDPDVNIQDFIMHLNFVANAMLHEKYKICAMVHGIYDPSWSQPVIVDIVARERHKMVLVSIVPSENYTMNVVEKSLTAMQGVADYCAEKYSMPCRAMCVAIDSRDDLVYYMQ